MRKILLLTLALCSLAALSGRSLPLPVPALSIAFGPQAQRQRPVFYLDIEGRTSGPEEARTVSLPGTLLQEGEAFSLDLTAFGGRGRLEVRVERAAKRSARFAMRLVSEGKAPIRGEIVVREGKTCSLGETIARASGCRLSFRARKI